MTHGQPHEEPERVAENLRFARGEIESAARACGRDPSSIRLLAVSKTFPAALIEEAYRAGQTRFGENRVQEAQGKIPRVRVQGLQWHLIGHLQSNKARRAVELFDVIETIDSEKLARKVGAYGQELGTQIKVFIEVNIGEEPQKDGVLPARVPQLARVIEQIPGLQLVGLMALPPYQQDPEKSRPFFRKMRALLDEVSQAGKSPLTELSMGMSHDYRVAIEEGATELRLGTAIFGPRLPD